MYIVPQVGWKILFNMARTVLLIALIVWFFGSITFGMYLLLKIYQYDTCEHLINSEKVMCSRLGGYLDTNAEQNTICVFNCSTSP